MNNTFVTHPSVRIKGTETNYSPVQCFDPSCHDRAPHMHCPFCVKTETYTDPVILKAHYRVKHVDKGIEFAGLKVLRCCDRCDIVGVIKGEKKFKGAHWHCYKCRNGFNRRDEAIKHYKTHFRNPQTTFQIQIAQDINQPVSQTFETEEAASCIPADSFSIQQGLTENVTTQPGSLTLLSRGLEGMVTMPGVGAVETVGLADTQTIMIIQDDEQGNLSSMNELVNTQDLTVSDHNQSDLTISEDVDDSEEATVEELRQKIVRLEKEKAEQQAHIAVLNKKIEEQSHEIAAYKLREQSLLEQLQQAQQTVTVPQDRVIETLCNQLETQHKQLIRSQITQLKQSLAAGSVSTRKMIVLNATPLVASSLTQNVNLATFDPSNPNPTPIAVALNLKSEEEDLSQSISEIETDAIHVEVNEETEEEERVKDQHGENIKEEDSHFDKSPEYSDILVNSLPDELSEDNPIIENDGNIINEPPVKRKRQK